MPRRTSRRAFGRWTPPSSGPTRIYSPIESLATIHLPIQGDYLLLRPTRLNRHGGRPKTRHPTIAVLSRGTAEGGPVAWNRKFDPVRSRPLRAENAALY